MKYKILCLFLAIVLLAVLSTGCLFSSPKWITTRDATDIASDSATLNGRIGVLSEGESATVYFLWEQDQGQGVFGPTPPQTTAPTTMRNEGGFSTLLTGLLPNTTYLFRACADVTKLDGTSQNWLGNIRSFTTGSE